jgi:hypothetical protein
MKENSPTTKEKYSIQEDNTFNKSKELKQIII